MLDWFTTIPGILIICGVILLVIAIILFIVGAKKAKKEESNITTQSVDNNISPVVNEESNVNATTIVPVVEDVVTPSMETTISAESVSTDVPVNEPVQIEEPVVNVVETPVVNNIVEDTTPVINIPDMDKVEEVNSVKNEEPSIIYGGELPTVDFTASEEKPVTIYGGNDPLEATQTLPRMEENHTPYGGVYPEVRIVEPTVSEPVPTPVEETVTAMPTIEPIVIDEPQVINIPVEEPVIIPEPTVVNNEANTQEQAPVVEEL